MIQFLSSPVTSVNEDFSKKHNKSKSNDWVGEDIGVTFFIFNKYEPLNSFKRSNDIK